LGCDFAGACGRHPGVKSAASRELSGALTAREVAQETFCDPIPRPRGGLAPYCRASRSMTLRAVHVPPRGVAIWSWLSWQAMARADVIPRPDVCDRGLQPIGSLLCLGFDAGDRCAPPRGAGRGCAFAGRRWRGAGGKNGRSAGELHTHARGLLFQIIRGWFGILSWTTFRPALARSR
jgi:hypothetical protein